MLEFDFKGITIDAIDRAVEIPYSDSDSHKRVKYRRRVRISVRFWDYMISDNLYELAFVKSVFNYFMQAHWKRSTKEGVRINLDETLRKGKGNDLNLSLCFSARQKDKISYLNICLKDGEGKLLNDLYLTGREVLMLDIAMGKAISLLQPSDVETLTGGC